MFKSRKNNRQLGRQLALETLDPRLALTSILLPPESDSQTDEEIAASIVARRPGISDTILIQSDDITAPVIEYSELDQIDTALAEFAIDRWGVLFGRDVVPELAGSILSRTFSSISTSSSLQDETNDDEGPLNQSIDGVQLPGVFQRLGSGHIVAAADGALTIIDVAIPDSPSIVSRIDGVNASELFVVGDSVVTVSQSPASDSDLFSIRNNFEINLFDISDLSAIQAVDTLSLTGSSITINVINNELIVRHNHRIDVPDIQTIPLDDDPTQLRFETQQEYLSRVGSGLSRYAFSMIRNANNENINLPSAEDFVSVGTDVSAFSTSFYRLQLNNNQFELTDSETIQNLPTDSFVTTPNAILTSTSYFDVEHSEFRTQIWVLGLSETGIEFSAAGDVSGNLVNPESLAFSNGQVRVFSQSRVSSDSFVTNLSVLGLDQSQLQVVAEVTDFADGNGLLAASFTNDFAYATAVEFDGEQAGSQTLQVFDLSNPGTVTQFGQTTAPGLLSYLRPFGTDRLVGVGLASVPKDDSSGNGTSSAGQFEVSVFDISDPTSPRVVDTIALGTIDIDAVRNNSREIPVIDPSGIEIDEQSGRIVFATTTAFGNSSNETGDGSSEILQLQFDRENSELSLINPIEIPFEPRLFAQNAQSLIALRDDRLATIVSVGDETDVTIIHYGDIGSSSINSASESDEESPDLATVGDFDDALSNIERLDVDGDGVVRPRDVLALIIFLNEQAELRQQSVDRVELTNQAVFAEFGHFDTNRDGRISPIDVLRIIQHLSD